jgi:hypothetical protein
VVVLAVGSTFHSLVTDDRAYNNYDDIENYSHNPILLQPTAANFEQVYTTARIGVYEPVSLGFKWALATQYAGFPARVLFASALVLHVTGAVGALLTCLALDRLLGAPRTAVRLASHAFGVILVAVHPLRAETLGWASCQPYLLCTVFALLCCYAHIRHLEQCLHNAAGTSSGDVTGGRWSRWRTLSLLAFALSVCSKAAALTLPAVLVALDLFVHLHLHSDDDTAASAPGAPTGASTGAATATGPGGRLALVLRSLLGPSRTGPFLLVAAAAARAASWASATASVDVRPLGGLEQVSRASYMVCFYLAKTLSPGYPDGLTVRRALPPDISPATPGNGLPYGAAVAGCALALAASLFAILCLPPPLGSGGGARVGPSVPIGSALLFGCYVLLLLPTLGFCSAHIWALAADRYCHLAMVLAGTPAAAFLARRLHALCAGMLGWGGGSDSGGGSGGSGGSGGRGGGDGGGDSCSSTVERSFVSRQRKAPPPPPAAVPPASPPKRNGEGEKGQGEGRGVAAGRCTAAAAISAAAPSAAAATAADRAPLSPLFAAALTLLLAAAAQATRRQLAVWTDSESLWTRSAALHPADALGFSSLGNALIEQRRCACTYPTCYCAPVALLQHSCCTRAEAPRLAAMRHPSHTDPRRRLPSTRRSPAPPCWRRPFSRNCPVPPRHLPCPPGLRRRCLCFRRPWRCPPPGRATT